MSPRAFKITSVLLACDATTFPTPRGVFFWCAERVAVGTLLGMIFATHSGYHEPGRSLVSCLPCLRERESVSRCVCRVQGAAFLRHPSTHAKLLDCVRALTTRNQKR